MRNKKYCASDSGQWRNNIKYDSKVSSKGVKREKMVAAVRGRNQN